MPYNLLDEQWIPVLTESGSRRTIAAWEITADLERDPVIAVDAPRPDFNGALMQFLIGLIQTGSLAPATELEWHKRREAPPQREELRTAFAGHREAFNLDGDGFRFAQDADLPDGKEVPVTDLLIDRKGNEHFIKPVGEFGLCFPCAATALYCLQINAPEGGRGHLTGMRGGGPLTTLVLAPATRLWDTLWMNVLPTKVLAQSSGANHSDDIARIFPWMAPTRSGSTKTGSITRPQDADIRQVYWTLPRRIRLDFAATQKGMCSICGQSHQQIVTRYRTRPYGVKYGETWMHPLTPYGGSPTDGLSPRKARAGRINYRNWIGLVLKSEEDKDRRLPAAVVLHCLNHRRKHLGKPTGARLWGFGYDMKQNRARCWYDGKMPVPVTEEKTAAAHADRSRRMVSAAERISGNVVTCLKEAWFSNPQNKKGDVSFVETAFWTGSEGAFFTHLNRLAGELDNPPDPSRPGTESLRAWHNHLCTFALRIFDEYALSGPIEDQDPARIARARNKLRHWNRGKKIKVDILQLPEDPNLQETGTAGGQV